MHLLERRGNVGDGAERPGDDDGVDARIGERQRLLRGLRQELDREAPRRRSLPRHALEFEGRVDPVDPLHLWGIVREIEAGADANFQHIAARVGNPGGAETTSVLVPHAHVDEERPYVFGVKAHGKIASTSWRASLSIRPRNFLLLSEPEK